MNCSERINEFRRRSKNIDPCSSLYIVHSVYLVCLVCLAVCQDCMPIHLSVPLFACLSVGLSVFCFCFFSSGFLPSRRFFCLSVCLLVKVSFSRPFCLSVLMPVYLSTCLSWVSVGVLSCLSVCLSVRSVGLLSIDLSVGLLSVCLSVCMYVHLSFHLCGFLSKCLYIDQYTAYVVIMLFSFLLTVIRIEIQTVIKRSQETPTCVVNSPDHSALLWSGLPWCLWKSDPIHPPCFVAHNRLRRSSLEYWKPNKFLK